MQDRILERSRTLFNERSFLYVSLRDLAQSAGVPVDLLVKHFRTKELLLEATVGFPGSSAALFVGLVDRHTLLRVLPARIRNEARRRN